MLVNERFSKEFLERFSKIIDDVRPTIKFSTIESIHYKKGSRFMDNQRVIREAINTDCGFLDALPDNVVTEYETSSDRQLRVLAKAGLMECASCDQYYEDKCRMDVEPEPERDWQDEERSAYLDNVL